MEGRYIFGCAPPETVELAILFLFSTKFLMSATVVDSCGLELMNFLEHSKQTLLHKTYFLVVFLELYLGRAAFAVGKV
jgi:hypothetical protein